MLTLAILGAVSLVALAMIAWLSHRRPFRHENEFIAWYDGKLF